MIILITHQRSLFICCLKPVLSESLISSYWFLVYSCWHINVIKCKLIDLSCFCRLIMFIMQPQTINYDLVYFSDFHLGHIHQFCWCCVPSLFPPRSTRRPAVCWRFITARSPITRRCVSSGRTPVRVPGRPASGTARWRQSCLTWCTHTSPSPRCRSAPKPFHQLYTC